MNNKRDGGLRFLLLRDELSVYEAAQVVEGRVGHHPDCIKLLVEAIKRGELAACLAPWQVTDYENGDYFAGVNEMETTVRRSDLNDWCRQAGIRIESDGDAQATASAAELPPHHQVTPLSAEVKGDEPAAAGPTPEPTPEPAPEPAPVPLPSGVIAQLFAGQHGWGASAWSNALGDPNSHPWLRDCRRMPGRPGRNGAATWDPVRIATQLGSQAPFDKRKKLLDQLDVLFETTVLSDWSDKWRSASDLLRHLNTG